LLLLQLLFRHTVNGHCGEKLMNPWSIWASLQELQVPKTLHGPIINDGWFSREAAWNPAEDIIVYVAESRAAEQTPSFGSSGGKSGSSGGSNGGSSGSNGKKAAVAAPRTWKGVAAAVEDWGELNTGLCRSTAWKVARLELYRSRAC
jgi:hypothetical protein